MKKIAVGGFLHETNCFVSGSTDYAYFAERAAHPPITRGAEIPTEFQGRSFAISGFLNGLGDDYHVVPLLHADGNAGALIRDEAFERIACELIGRLSEALPIDALYLDLHGAAVTETFEDAEGELLRRARAAVGESVPIVISLDYHANITRQMAACADSILIYQTYPHVDRFATGQRAAKSLAMLLERGRPNGRAIQHMPFLLPINDQCTLIEPSASIVGHSVCAQGDVFSLSYAAGFPASDLAECGPVIVGYAATQAEADQRVRALADFVRRCEPQFPVPIWSVDEAVSHAIARASDAVKPIILADTQDNPGAGGSGDTTGVLEALVRLRASDAIIGYLCDPLAAAAAHRAGEGSQIDIALGGRAGDEGVHPYRASFQVVRLGSGRFRTTGPFCGDREVDLGSMALLRIDGVSVAVTSRRMQAHDQAPFRHLGVEPSSQKILVLKSAVHFRADFQSISEEILVVASPGGNMTDPARYPFKKLRDGVRLRPLGPVFVSPDNWSTST